MPAGSKRWRKRNGVCPNCQDPVHPEEQCESCTQCDACCGCGDLFDADELGLDPEEDEQRRYGEKSVSRELLEEFITLSKRIASIYGGGNA